jgi:hypothetical protein
MPSQPQQSLRTAWPGASLALVALGCATYPDRMAGALRDFQSGHLEDSLEAYSDPDRVRSEFLSGAEAGTVALASGDWELARSHFERAVEAAREVERSALASPENLAAVLSTWAINDMARAYQGEGFERVYVHASLALTYLAQGKLDDVYVEARLANQLLEAEERLYETRYQAGGIGHLVSAVTYELLGQRDQAYIDYQRMEEKGVGTALAGRALVRLAGELGRSEDLGRWVELYGAETPRPAGAASIVVLAGVGLGPFKTEAVLPIPTGDGLFQMAVPGYVDRPQPVEGLRLVANGSESLRTEVVERVSQVARENLEDRLLWTAAKSAARGLLKRELTKALEEEYDEAGLVAGTLFTLLTERADTRCWLTLPDSWQACRLFVPPGVHGFTLEAIGGEALDLGVYELEPGETLIVIARTVDTRLYAHPIGGRPVEPSPGGAIVHPVEEGKEP